MLLNRSKITELRSIVWFQNCGRELPSELFGIQKAVDESQALNLLVSSNWADARTEAQGDLTGYLSKHHNNAYGGYWNNLVKEAAKLIECVALESIHSALQRQGWPDEFSKPIIVDLTRAVLEISYREKFRKAPAFFETVFVIYKAGYLPCGWSTEISQWPDGAIIAY